MEPHRTTVGAKKTYGCVNMSDFLEKLKEKLQPNPTSLKNYKRMYAPKGLHTADRKGPLETAVLYDRVQVTPKSPYVVAKKSCEVKSVICSSAAQTLYTVIVDQLVCWWPVTGGRPLRESDLYTLCSSPSATQVPILIPILNLG